MIHYIILKLVPSPAGVTDNLILGLLCFVLYATVIIIIIINWTFGA